MRIVLVDPSVVVVECLSRSLIDNNMIVLPFHDTKLALERITVDPTIDVLMTSFETQGLSGLQLCAKARAVARDDNRLLYILMMSSNEGSDRLIEALDNGADDFIKKPPDMSELLARLRCAERTKLANTNLLRLATVDPLSEVYNRRAFLEKGDKICRACSVEQPGVVAMFDIDNFKQVNDSYGHDVGDLVIRRVAAEIACHCPGVTGRLGGEEFACAFKSPIADAISLIDRCRIAIMGNVVTVIDSVEISVTVSSGIAVSNDCEEISSALKRADIALYKAKLAGRNRVST